MSRLRMLLIVIGILVPVAGAAADDVRLDAARRAALTALPVLRGTPVATRDLEGRIVVVAFFASWCPPCGPEFDNLKRLHAEYGPVILAVNIFEPWNGLGGEQQLDRFLARKAPAFTVLGDGERIAEAFGAVDRIPTVFVFRRDGHSALHFVHARGATKTHATYEELVAAVRAAP